MRPWGSRGKRDALVILDRGTDYKDCVPLLTKDADDAYGAFVEFLGKRRVEYAWTDSAKELIKALKDLGIPHGKATPGRHTANAICERTVRKVVEGARTLLEHAGLAACFWPWAVRYWCFMDNAEVRTDGHSAWSKRFAGKHFEGPRLPFGCRVEYLPRPEEVKALPKFETRAQVGIVLGYYLQPG